MNVLSRYWNLVRLVAAGSRRVDERSSAREFFQQQFPPLQHGEAIDHDQIQLHLIQLIRNPQTETTARTQAELCLRCFISHQIEQVCIQLEQQFGAYYGFTRQDLFALVLDDDGTPFTLSDRAIPAARYQSLASQILQSFKPESGNLSTWTIRLVRQQRDLNQFLLERGLYLVSDWGILNDTKPERLRRVLTQQGGLSPAAVEQACVLLESYHTIYLGDRLKRREKGRCPVPTEEQLQRIAIVWHEQTTLYLSPLAVLNQLQALAQQLRQDRIQARVGLPHTQLIDSPETQAVVEQLTAAPTQDDDTDELEFLQSYRDQFLDSLDQAFDQVVRDRLQKSKNAEQANRFLTGLHLFHCQRLSMTAIAPQIGLRSQDNVTRLLKLKDFRADIRRHMLKSLQRYVLEKAKEYHTPDAIQQLDTKIETALDEQIEAMIQQEAEQSKTPKTYLSGSVFSQRLCQYLDSLIATLAVNSSGS